MPAPQSNTLGWPPELRRWMAENAVRGETARVQKLKRRYAFAICDEYGHLQHDWWGRSADASETISPQVLVPKGFEVPAAEVSVSRRRPSAPSRLAKTIVERFTGMVFSENRRPRVVVQGDPDTEAFLVAAIEQSKFWMRMREARNMGGACGSVAVSIHLRAGRFEVDVHPAWQVEPWWEDRRALRLKALLKTYTFFEQEAEVDDKGVFTGRLVDREYLYRRFIDDQVDVIYKPWPLDEGAPPWDDPTEVDDAVEHGLGICPALWVQNLPRTDDYDGDPDCEGAWQSIESYDRLFAQLHRSLLVNLDPTAVVRVPQEYIDQFGGTIRKGSDNAFLLPIGSDAGYMEMQGAAAAAAQDVLDRLKQQVLDTCRAVLVDPEKISGAAQSAKAIEYVYAPMIEKSDDLRGQYGESLVRPALEVALLIARAVHGGQDDVEIDPAVIDLPPRPDGAAHRIGRLARVGIQWGPYFAPTAQDVVGSVQASAAAKAAGLVDREHASKRVAALFNVENVDAMLKKIDEEAEPTMSEMAPPPELPEEAPPDGVDRVTIRPAGTPRAGTAPRLSASMREERTPPAGEGGRP